MNIIFKHIKQVFVAALILILSGCSNSESEQGIVSPITFMEQNQQQINVLWSTIIPALSAQPLWNPRDKYDTAHLLLQPMQYAFTTKDKDKIDNFNSFFIDLDTYFEEAISESRGGTTQFMFFVSEYLVLKSQSGQLSTADISISNKLQDWFTNFVNAPAWMWGREPFSNLIQRNDWKLSTKEPDYSYYRAMFDEDLFIYGIYANLTHLLTIDNGLTASEDYNQIQTKLNLQLQSMLVNEVSFTSDSDGVNKFHWLFQPGVWWQHPDYEFAGNLVLAPELESMRIENIATDTSHMHRWPVWLNAYKRAFLNNSEMENYIEQLKLGFAQQFNDRVYVASSDEFQAPRINNFFDGHNGVYRFQYQTLGESGYGPYQLSGVLFGGWYGNLQSADVFSEDIKMILSNGLQLNTEQLELYLGPNTSRDRNPLYVRPDYFSNGLAELNLRVTWSLLKD